MPKEHPTSAARRRVDLRHHAATLLDASAKALAAGDLLKAWRAATSAAVTISAEHMLGRQVDPAQYTAFIMPMERTELRGRSASTGVIVQETGHAKTDPPI